MQVEGCRQVVTGAVLVVMFGSVLSAAPLATGSTLVVGDVASDENEAPLAEAGLDQEVPVNSTVYLDATGSRDPDGSVESYEWSVERPDGSTIEPACGDCPRTEFRVTMNGTYEVTVTVTDDDGASSSDTLYVQANAVEGPSVELAGPTDVSANVTGTYTATAQAGASSLLRFEWERDGTDVADTRLDGESASHDFVAELAPGRHTLSVRVVSEMGRTDTARLTVNVSDRPVRPCAEATWNRTAGSWNVEPCVEGTGDNETAADEDCYNAQSERAREWETNYPRKEFACHNDVWFGGESPTIVNTDEDGDFSAKGVNATLSEARGWTGHPDVSIRTVSGFKRLNFATQEAWLNARTDDYPWGNDPKEEPPKEVPSKKDAVESPENCKNVLLRYRPPSCIYGGGDNSSASL